MKNRLLLYAFAFMTLTQVLWMASCTSTPKQVEETDNRAVIRFETTMGNFEMALFNETPIHRDAYLLLARIGYYDSILIHRVIDNFVVQAGDPNSKNALPGELVGDGEPFKLPSEIRFPKLYHKRGMVNAAREGDKAAIELVDEYISYLACGLATIINIFQPEILSIGGGISAEGETLLAPVRKMVEKQQYSHNCKNKTVLKAAELGNDAGIIGAALLWR